jgi:hypothetical protein
MVTSAPIRHNEAQPTAVVQTWPRVEAILDADGQHLTDVGILGPPRGGRVELDDIGEPAALIDQYFGRGEQTVMLSLEDGRIVASLRTRWEGSRRSWWLEVDDWLPER